jgi:hypothetical protein
MRSFRFSIVGLMGLVLLAAIGAAGLANPSGPWAGILALLARAVLCLALVGAACRTGAERVWWLGFASFGWIYLGFQFPFFGLAPQKLPTQALLEAIAHIIGVPRPEVQGGGGSEDEFWRAFHEIGRSLWAMVAAVLGGFLATALFAPAATRQVDTEAGAAPAGRVSRRSWVLPSVIVLSSLALIASIAVAGARLQPGVWAGSTYLLTWWLLCLTALGALFGSGRCRAFWIGATFFGALFMILVFHQPASADSRAVSVTVQLLEALRPRFETLVAGSAGDPDGIAAKNRRIRKVLQQPMPTQLPDETTLEDFLNTIRDAARASYGVIPIYVDPIGLQEAEKSMTSTVRGVDLEGVPLGTALSLCLKQLDLQHVVKDGLLLITSVESEDQTIPSQFNDPFQIVGHCLLALIAAALGGAAAPFVCDSARKVRETTASN